MTGQRPLALMLGSAAHDRLHAALSLAAASAALGRVVAIYLHADAVRLLDPGLNWAEDVRFAAVGSPAIAELLGRAMELGGSEASREGKVCVSTCRYRWRPSH